MANQFPIPKVGEYIEGCGTVVAVRDATPPPPPLTIECVFEDCAMQMVARLNGRIVKKHGEPNGLCGLVKNLEAVQAEAESDLEFVVFQARDLDLDARARRWVRRLPVDDTCPCPACGGPTDAEIFNQEEE